LAAIPSSSYRDSTVGDLVKAVGGALVLLSSM
jgi:hypothetical protein